MGYFQYFCAKEFFMKLFLLSFFVITGLHSFGQELSVDAGGSITFDVGSSINLVGLELIPSAEFVIGGENAVALSSTPINIDGDDSISQVYQNLNALNNFEGTLIFHYKDENVIGVDESGLILEIEDPSNIWQTYNATLDTDLNTLTYNFTGPISFLTVTALSSIPLSIEDDLGLLKEISIYPNPVESTLYISNSEKPLSFELYNMLGELLLKTTQNTLDFSPLSNSVYFLKITDISSSKTTTVKIIKK